MTRQRSAVEASAQRRQRRLAGLAEKVDHASTAGEVAAAQVVEPTPGALDLQACADGLDFGTGLDDLSDQGLSAVDDRLAVGGVVIDVVETYG